MGPEGRQGQVLHTWQPQPNGCPSPLQATLPSWLRETREVRNQWQLPFGPTVSQFCLGRWSWQLECSCQEATEAEEAWVLPEEEFGHTTPSPRWWGAVFTALAEVSRAKTLLAWAWFWTRVVTMGRGNWAEEHKEGQALEGEKGQRKEAGGFL